MHYNIVHLGIKRQDEKNTCKIDSCKSFGRNTCQDLETHSLFSCQQCHYLTRRKGDFQIHIQSVHEGIIYQCQHCYLVTKFEDLLKRHTKFEHSKILFACTEAKCSYETYSNNLLREHVESKHGKPHKCDQCNYASFRLRDLRIHLKLHSGEERPNKCNQCNFASSYASILRIHLKTHSGEKPNKCTQCDFASCRADNLNSHLKTHTRPT